MEFEKNVGKKEGLLRVVIGIAFVIFAFALECWQRWATGFIGLALLATALVGT